MKRLMCAALWVLLAAGAAGCNTVQGLGKDIEKGGEAIQRAVSK